LDLNQRVQVKVDAGKEFTVIIAKKSFQDMKLNLGSLLYMNFGASSVHVL
jgi:molybdopterin-binding protein